MGLPEVPPGEFRDLLQEIWHAALETDEWPTFAELDHRWDSEHDIDVIGVLDRLPQGLLKTLTGVLKRSQQLA
jgi:hypothetical protein